jgi:hypothetical protein
MKTKCNNLWTQMSLLWTRISFKSTNKCDSPVFVIVARANL